MTIRNERGITLVEVVATIVILSFIGVLISTVLLNSMKFSDTLISKNTMQQQANYILSTLTKIHQQEEEYEITQDPVDACSWIVTPASTGITKTFQDDKLCFTILDTNNTSATDIKVEKNDSDIKITLTVADKNQLEHKVVINGYLHRLKGN